MIQLYGFISFSIYIVIIQIAYNETVKDWLYITTLRNYNWAPSLQTKVRRDAAVGRPTLVRDTRNGPTNGGKYFYTS